MVRPAPVRPGTDELFNSFLEGEAAEAKVGLVLTRLVAAPRLARGSVPDYVIAWGRACHLLGLSNYSAASEAGVLPNLPGIDFSRPDFEILFNNACLHLMTTVGLALTLEQGELPPPLFHPDAWKEGRVRMGVTWQVEQSSILMPNGSPHSRLQVRSNITADL